MIVHGRRYTGLSVAVVLALFLACKSNPAAPSQPVISPLQTKVNTIMQDVATLRGFDFKRPVLAATTTRSAYGAWIQKQITQGYSPDELDGLSKEYAQMGFLTEADTPLIKILIDYYSAFPAAYYVPGTDSLYILDDQGSDDFLLNVYISHELTHALQDQNLNMRPTLFPTYSHFNSDAELALTSLIEGDAYFTQYAYMGETGYSITLSRAFDSAQVWVKSDRSAFLSDSNQQGAGPPFLDVKGFFPYEAGGAFVANNYSKTGSWSIVNGLYAMSTVPRSSADINRMEQTAVTSFDVSAVQNLLAPQGASISFTDDDNAGFALLLGLFYGALDRARVGRSLDWTGDRFTFVKKTGQAYGTLVWAMAFKNADAARYVYGKADSLLRARALGGKTAAIDSTVDSTGIGSRSYATSLDTARLYLSGSQIWWLENTQSQTQPIVSILKSQQTTTVHSVAIHPVRIPITLSIDGKHRAVQGLLRYKFRR